MNMMEVIHVPVSAIKILVFSVDLHHADCRPPPRDTVLNIKKKNKNTLGQCDENN